MNKVQITLFFLFPAFVSIAQVNTNWGVPYDEQKKIIIYEEVVTSDGIDKATLYSRGLEWILMYYTAGSNKITEKNGEEGLIKLKDRINIYKIEKKTKVNDVIIEYTLEIHLKDNRFKYIIHNFRSFQGSTSFTIDRWMQSQHCDEENAKRRYASLNEEMTKTIESLKSYMLKGNTKEGDDW